MLFLLDTIMVVILFNFTFFITYIQFVFIDLCFKNCIY